MYSRSTSDENETEAPDETPVDEGSTLEGKANPEESGISLNEIISETPDLKQVYENDSCTR